MTIRPTIRPTTAELEEVNTVLDKFLGNYIPKLPDKLEGAVSHWEVVPRKAGHFGR